MSKSILQDYDECHECFCCRSTQGLEEHHIFFGTSNRKNSEHYGLKVLLCTKHHRGSKSGVHFNKELDKTLKELGQKEFEKTHSHEEFMSIFGRNYL